MYCMYFIMIVIIVIIGTLFLWVYWPSFNSAVAGSEVQQTRAIINTYISLSACVLTTFAVSSLTDKKARFNMVSGVIPVMYSLHRSVKGQRVTPCFAESFTMKNRNKPNPLYM